MDWSLFGIAMIGLVSVVALSLLLQPVLGRYLAHLGLVVGTLALLIHVMGLDPVLALLCMILVFTHATYLNSVKVRRDAEVRTLPSGEKLRKDVKAFTDKKDSGQ